MTQLTIQQAIDLARRHHQAGRMPEAEHLYRQVLAREPGNARALHLLGVLAGQMERLEEAIELIGQAIQIKPDDCVFYSNLGEIYRRAGRFDEAIATLRQALVVNPNLALAHNNLGTVLATRGQMEQAVAAFQQAIKVDPKLPDPHANLGNALRAMGQLDQAIAAYRQAIILNPKLAETHNDLGNALQTTGQLGAAIAAYRQAIILDPNWAEAYTNLGSVLKVMGLPDQAMAAYHQALTFNPDLAEAHNNLGSALMDQGRLKEAIASFQQTFELKPDYVAAQSNLIYTLQFDDSYDASALLRQAQAWNQRHALPLRKLIAAHHNDPTLHRRLRIGYISPDFRDHVVGWNLLPLLSHHDHRQVEIFCYANVSHPSPMTDKLRACADVWRNIAPLTDEQTAEVIRQDQIDILIDLTLHMAGNRLLVFARKPAPIQLTYLGYCGTTGLSTIDYRFSDPYLDPPDTDLSCYSEKTIRLPRTYWCYEPGGNAPDVSPPPMLASNHITFGCLNNFAKVSAPALDLWARVLANVPQSRLILHANPGSYLDGVRQRFVRAGVAADRLEFVAKQPWLDYMRTYHRIDIALDPFPYAGGITTCDGLWMGVPIVSLRGKTAVGRGGYSILSNLGLADLAASTPEEYLGLATQLANDPSRLIELRRTLRERMKGSPLMDAPGFARDIEAAYRKMWRGRCDLSQPPRILPKDNG